MITLTGFADEISPNLDVQLDVLKSEGIKYLEFRSVWNKNVVHLTNDELRQIKEELDSRGFQISAIGSPIGKISILDSFESHLQQFERVIKIANYFNTNYIRIFSFFIPENDDPFLYRTEVISRMKTLVSRAEEAGVILLHENEKHIYGDNAERCLDLFETFHSPHFRAIFDPANFVQCGLKPYTDAYPLLHQYIDYLHVKDAFLSNGKVVPAGQGDGQIEEILSELVTKGYDGFMSLEPHLAAEGLFSGYSGPNLFREASQSLKELLVKVHAKFNNNYSNFNKERIR